MHKLIAVLVITALASQAQTKAPHFEPDPYWPQQLPNHWMLGQVSGIYVDRHDHVWVIHRPRTLDGHDKYGAAKGAIVIIRPDGYIAMNAPLDSNSLGRITALLGKTMLANAAPGPLAGSTA